MSASMGSMRVSRPMRAALGETSSMNDFGSSALLVRRPAAAVAALAGLAVALRCEAAWAAAAP